MLAAPAHVSALVETPAGAVPLPLRGEGGRLSLRFAAEAPVAAVRLVPVAPDTLTVSEARVVADGGWSNLAPDWTIGPLRLPARPDPAPRGGAARIPGWAPRVSVGASEAVGIAGTRLETGVVGVLELVFDPPLAPGRWRLWGEFRDEAGRPALVAPRVLRPGASNPLDALCVLARTRGAAYAGTVRLAATTPRLVFRPREEAGAVDIRALWIARDSPFARAAGLPAALAAAAARVRPPPGGGTAAPAVAPRMVATGPRVSIVTATRDAPEHLARFLRTLADTAYRPFDLTLVDNGTTDPTALALLAAAERGGARVLRDRRRFNFASLSNAGAETAAGEVLVFGNNDIAFVDPDWLGALVAALAEPGVGIAGARLLYPDGRVQHAGLVLAGEARVRHAERFLAGGRPGHRNRQRETTRVSAVTGALLAIPAGLFRELGGFDPALGVLLNDADLCLRAGAAGFGSVLVPGATAVHYESASIGPPRGDDLHARGGPLWAFERAEEARLFRARWGARLDADPCYPSDCDPLAADFRRPR